MAEWIRRLTDSLKLAGSNTAQSTLFFSPVFNWTDRQNDYSNSRACAPRVNNHFQNWSMCTEACSQDCICIVSTWCNSYNTYPSRTTGLNNGAVPVPSEWLTKKYVPPRENPRCLTGVGDCSTLPRIGLSSPRIQLSRVDWKWRKIEHGTSYISTFPRYWKLGEGSSTLIVLNKLTLYCPMTPYYGVMTFVNCP